MSFVLRGDKKFATRASYFERNDNSEVSHEALDSLTSWMMSDLSLAIDDKSKSFIHKKMTAIVSRGRDSDYPVEAFQEMSTLERVCVTVGALSLVEVRE